MTGHLGGRYSISRPTAGTAHLSRCRSQVAYGRAITAGAISSLRCNCRFAVLDVLQSRDCVLRCSKFFRQALFASIPGFHASRESGGEAHYGSAMSIESFPSRMYSSTLASPKIAFCATADLIAFSGPIEPSAPVISMTQVCDIARKIYFSHRPAA
jgi:hypothetical protein